MKNKINLEKTRKTETEYEEIINQMIEKDDYAEGKSSVSSGRK